MSPRNLSLHLSAAFVCGVVGAVYGTTLKTELGTTLVETAVVNFVLGAAVGLVCGWLTIVGMRQLDSQSLVMRLSSGVILGLLVGLTTGQDWLLCAMAGEVGALILSPETSSEVVY